MHKNNFFFRYFTFLLIFHPQVPPVSIKVQFMNLDTRITKVVSFTRYANLYGIINLTLGYKFKIYRLSN